VARIRPDAGRRDARRSPRFGSIRDARVHCHVFFSWYDTEHHHAGLGLLTPYGVHHALAEQRVAARATVLAAAYAAHPERFSGEFPQPPACPHGGLDQPTRRPAALARIIEDPALRLAHGGVFA
jgi:putative transposase